MPLRNQQHKDLVYKCQKY